MHEKIEILNEKLERESCVGEKTTTDAGDYDSQSKSSKSKRIYSIFYVFYTHRLAFTYIFFIFSDAEYSKSESQAQVEGADEQNRVQLQNGDVQLPTGQRIHWPQGRSMGSVGGQAWSTAHWNSVCR